MKKKGFTLIELLAVIIILAIIALIATPIVLNVVEDAREKANKNSAYGVLDGARLYYAESMLDSEKSKEMNGTTDILSKIGLNGARPEKGNVYINNNGEIKIAVVYGKKCYIKDFTATDLTVSEDIDNCAVVNVPEEPVEKPNLISKLMEQYSASNTVGLLKDGDNYYYKGTNAEVANNFVWYEGHLWRVIQINSDNTITMITGQPITTIQPTSTVWTTEQQYKDSYINTWLNQVFYNSISDKSKIKQSTFNVGIYTNVSEITSTQYVGLLDETQYTRAGLANSYLDIKDIFWLGNRYDSASMRRVGNNGDLNNGSRTHVYGGRPVVKISDLTITAGDGTLTSPFRETKTSTNTSNVKVGEYISVPGSSTYCKTVTSGRCLFRVISKDSDSVKVILNGLLPSPSGFGSTTTFNASIYINTPLVNFANSISSNYRYSGNKTFNIGMYGEVYLNGINYTVVSNTTYSGNVGLPVVGEMFSGNDIDVSVDAKTFVNVATIENPTASSYFWVMNAYDSTYVRNVNSDGSLNCDKPTFAYGGRPVLYLNLGTNSNLTFTKGEGTAESPYWLGN